MSAFPTASELFKSSPFLKLSLYGGNGVGKTSIGARCPRPIIFLLEPQALPSIHAANPDAIGIVIDSWPKFMKWYDIMKKGQSVELPDGQKALEIRYEGETVLVQTLVIDSWTDLQRLLVLHTQRKDPSATQLRNFSFDPLADYNQLQLQEWGRIIDISRLILEDQRSLRINTLFLSLEDDVRTEGPRRILPSMYGSALPSEFGQYFNAQGYMSKKVIGGEVARVIDWDLPSMYQTKKAPRFPSAMRFEERPGVGTIGSLLLYTMPNTPGIAHAEDDFPEGIIEVATTKTAAAEPATTAQPRPRPAANETASTEDATAAKPASRPRPRPR